MTISDVVRTLNARGIFPYVEEGKLKTRSDAAITDPALIDLIRSNRDDLIAFLAAGSGTANAVQAIVPIADREAPAPLSFAQRRLWFIHELEGGSAHYNINMNLTLRGRLDMVALQRTIDAIVTRHEVLRTRFEQTPTGELQQFPVVLNTVPIVIEDLRELPADERTARVRQRIRDEAARSFDLTHPLLLRSTVLRVEDDEHVVLFSTHHIASDGWSKSILLDEFRRLYAAFHNGEDNPLSPLTVQYRDYAAWQRTQLSGAALEAQTAWWTRRLAGAPPVHALPLARSRPAQQRFLGGQHRIELPRDVVARARAFCIERGATPFMLTHAVFALLLARLGGENDVVVGTPVSGRVHPDLEPLVGFFINTLVLRTVVAPEQSFADFLAADRHDILEAFNHQTLPFELLVDALNPERSLSYSPLFQILFSYHTASGHTFALPGLDIDAPEQAENINQFDIEFNVADDGDDIRLAISYNRTLFDARQIEMLANAYRVLLGAAVATPDTAVARLPLLDEAERNIILAGRDGETRHESGQADLCARFAGIVAAHPQAAAVQAQDGALDFAELDARSNRLAHYLRDRGAGPSGRVGICLKRSVDLPIAIMGVLKTGAAYVPLDPELPEDRLQALLDDAAVELVLTHSEHWHAVSFGDREVLPLDIAAGLLDEKPTTPLDVTVGGDATAWVIYTSGSTGRPKGVCVSHRAALNYVAFVVDDYLGAGAAGGVVATPFSFDATVTTLIAPLFAGKPTLLCADDLDDTIRDVLGHARSPDPLLFKLTPAHLDVLSQLSVSPVSTTAHIVVVGGEQLTTKTVERFRERVLPNAVIVNEYGPTEATVGCSILTLRPDAPLPDSDVVPIGHPIRNTRLYVLDRHDQPVPDGVTGELMIAGTGLADGYLGLTELTASRFVADTVGGAGRMYRTGDLVRWRHDGMLEFVGRADDQVKLNGFRIEPGEIEARLAEHPDVVAACVSVREDAQGTRRLVAHVIPRDSILSTEQDESEIERWRHRRIGALRTALQRRLPAYMLPAAYVLVDAFPLTANDKIDRAALPAPADDDYEKETFVAPETPTQSTLSEIWGRVLGLDTIGIDDNFFRIGGHSLLATRMVSDIAESLGQRLPVRAVFECPTIRSLAARLDAEVQGDATQAAEAIQPMPRDGMTPLSYGQRRLWFIDQLEGGSRQYHISSALRLTGPLDRRAFAQALDTIVARHEILRTRFVAVDGTPFQVIDPAAPQPVEDIDLSHLAEAEREARLPALLSESAAAPFDLAVDHMLRCRLVRLDDTDHVVALTLHHIASDGWSTGVLVREFAALYEAYQAGRDNPLPALQLQYADFAHWQRRVLSAEAVEPHLAYWRRQLADLPRAHSLPLDRPRPSQQDFRGDAVQRTLPAGLTARLRDFAQDHDASLFMLLQSLLALLYARWSGEDDIAVGSPVAGREERGLEPLIGFFINSLIVRTDLSGEPTFAALLERTRRTVLDGFAHQALPFDMLVDALKPERSLNHPPLAQVSLTLHNLDHVDLRLPGLRISGMADGEPKARYDIELHVAETDDALKMRWVFSTSLFDRQTIERLADSFVVLAEAAMAMPERPVHALPLLPAHDHELLANWSGPHADALPDLCIHQLFEVQAERDPQAIALSFDGQHLSYGELNAAANRVAHYLRSQGIAPDDRVGLCVDRSLEMTIGMLGILKAGAAYVPLDPTYPEERIAAMLEESGIEHALVQQATLEALPLLGELIVLPLDPEIRDVLLQVFPDTNPQDTGVTPGHLAYVIFTSGSTGRPKGVLVEHRGLVNLALEQGRRLSIGPGQRVLGFFSMSFDVSVMEWAMALANGASLHLCHESDRVSADRLSDFLVRERITFAGIPPVLLAVMPPDRDYALQTLMIGGESCDERLAWRWRERCRVVNSYGPSETTVAATHGDIEIDQPVTLGHPLANVEVRVCNGHGVPQPIGVPGELRIGGVGVARGYLGNPGLTAERFVSDPERERHRFYLSGDLVRWRADGRLQFLGRIDEQVKIRGFRIEPGEIRSHLLSHPSVLEVVVIARADQGTTRLVAYLVWREEEEGDLAKDHEVVLGKQLREHLRERVPDYMVPAAFVLVDAIPMTRNGKVDVARLPVPDYHAQQAYVAPTGEIETRLVEIWRQVLRIEQIGVHDNFFEIGGDSILSIQVVSRANQAGISITTKQLFETQTIAALAAVAELGRTVSAPQEAAVGAAPLLPIHHLFLGAESRDPHHYNQAVMLEVPSDFSRAALPVVIEALYSRHDALRLRFFRDADGAWSSTHQPFDAAMLADSCVIEAMPTGEEAEAALTVRCTHWQRSFDLSAGPLLRAVYFEAATEQERGRLLLLVHHIVVDGVSWRILLSDLERAYGQWRSGAPVALEAKTSSYQQWGQALHAHVESGALQAERAYWVRQNAIQVPAIPLDFGTDEPREIATTRALAIQLDEEETRALLHRCNGAYRTRIDELLLAGVYLGMRAWTGESALRIRLEGHGREDLFDDIDFTETVGWFTSVYPLTLDVPVVDVASVVKTVKEQCRAVPSNGIGYGLLRHLARDPELLASESGEPALEFNYLGQFDHALNVDTLFQPAPESVGEKISRKRRRMHQLGLSGKVFGGTLNFVLDYSEEQYSVETMQRLADAIREGWRSVIRHCADRSALAFTPSDFPLARLDQNQIDVLQGCYPRMERLYPATPLQAGLHYESQIRPSTYVVQTCPVLRGKLDTTVFRSAWQQTLQRHDVLRTAFTGEGDTLHQVVLDHVTLPWREEDWREVPADEQAARLERFLQTDREAAFDFTQAPLLRIAVFRLEDERYQIVWTSHHIIVDGWSSPIIYRDVIAFYRAGKDGQPPSLSAPAPYERHIAWLMAQDAGAATDHWKRMLGDIEAPTPLSVDTLPTDGTTGSREHVLELDADATAALQLLAQSLRLTPNSLVQWAWAYLLHRYSGQDDVVFGATISGRNPSVPGIEEMVGLFINSVPVRVSFPSDETFAEAVSRLQRDFQTCSDHGHLALTEIQRQSRVPAGTPLFESLLVFENLPIDAKAEADGMRASLEVEMLANQRQTQYKLTLIATLDRQLKIRLGYRGEDFAAATIARLATHFTAVLESLPAMAGGKGIEPVLITAEERAQLAVWSAPVRAYAQDTTIHGRFEQCVDRTPDAIALIHGDRTMTYAELDQRANRVAQTLIAQGVGRDHAVALRTHRGVEFIVGLLGALKAGAAYLPIDPDYPQERVDRMIGDNHVDVLLTTGDVGGAVQLDALKRFDLDAVAGFETASTHRPQVHVHIDDLAFVMHTSGSTGVPKGVRLPHRTIVNLMDSVSARYPELSTPEPSLQFAAIGFDMSLYEVAGALFHGGALVLLDDEQRLDARQLIESMHRAQIARAYLPTALLGHVAQSALDSGVSLDALRVVQTAGEQLVVSDVLRRWAQRDGFRLLNLYGPTESHVVSEQVLDGDPDTWPALPSIGRPIDNVSLHVLDSTGRHAPVGVIGELLIGGDGLARDYADRPDLTADRFVSYAFHGGEPIRLYRTGDLARWRPDGTLDYLGRADRQVKIRGFRVELGEIETALCAHSAVSEAVVIAAGEGDRRRLVAYVVPAGEVGADDAAKDSAELQADLIATLRRRLPAFMLPSAIVPVSAIPLTPNGKVDRRALPDPERTIEREHVPPATDTERRLAAIWQTILGVERVGSTDRFFEIGGHSLLAMRMLSAATNEFGCQLKIRDVFTHQSVAELAQWIDALASDTVIESRSVGSDDDVALEETEW